MLRVKSTTLRRFGGFTIKFYFIHCPIPPPNFDTSAICRISAETLIHKAYCEFHEKSEQMWHFFLPLLPPVKTRQTSTRGPYLYVNKPAEPFQFSLFMDPLIKFFSRNIVYLYLATSKCKILKSYDKFCSRRMFGQLGPKSYSPKKFWHGRCRHMELIRAFF